jgi:hypothetical protein
MALQPTLLQLLQSRTVVDCDTMDVEGGVHFAITLLSSKITGPVGGGFINSSRFQEEADRY